METKELTHDQKVMQSTWCRGSDWYPVRKVASAKWIVTNEGIWEPLGHIPVVFKTKKSAIEFVSNLCMIRFRQWQGLEA